MSDTKPNARGYLQRALVTLLLVVVYLAAAYAHSRTQNADVSKFDQDLYLLGARALHDSNFEVVTNRLHMPIYLYFQAFFYDSALPLAETFARAKALNVALSVALLGALHLFFVRTLPRGEARLLTLVLAFTVFVFRAAYVQVECLFYALAFAGFVALSRLWARPTLAMAVLAGVLEALAHLTKGSVVPGLGLFVLLFASREGHAALRGTRAPAEIGKRLGALALLGATFLSVLAPYLRTSKERFGAYFFAAGPSYAMWLDSWEEWFEKERQLGSYERWHLLPREQIPSAANYLRTHGIGQIALREARGLAEMLGNTLLSHGYVEYVVVFGAFAATLAWQRGARGQVADPEQRAEALFAVVYLVFYVFLFAFYGPIAAGNRFILTLFLPTLYALMRAHARDAATVVVFGRTIAWRHVTTFAFVSILLHVFFRLPATITRIPAGG